ncbi:MAG TPA: Lpg1974 family pore-forming outer membrane protein [Chlamydiales bacterium]|nr:Lpg1974 family pore-forming outer membrane protein [Chlamydiales bacterium]
MRVWNIEAKGTLHRGHASFIGNNTIPTVKNDKERFWGIGPELGVEADWHMGWNWSLYGSFDVVTYYGSIHTTTHNTDTFTTTISQSDGKISRPFRSIATDASFGLRWDKAWPVASEVLLTVKLGVEQHRIYDFSNLGSDGTLSMDGANLAAGVGYRYCG